MAYYLLLYTSKTGVTLFPSYRQYYTSNLYISAFIHNVTFCIRFSSFFHPLVVSVFHELSYMFQANTIRGEHYCPLETIRELSDKFRAVGQLNRLCVASTSDGLQRNTRWQFPPVKLLIKVTRMPRSMKSNKNMKWRDRTRRVFERPFEIITVRKKISSWNYCNSNDLRKCITLIISSTCCS